MAVLYFDESIRDNGGFIVGALVVAAKDVSSEIGQAWRALGLDPRASEYKSSALKANNDVGQRQRSALGEMLQRVRLGLTVCPTHDRRALGVHCAALISQLRTTDKLGDEAHELYLDQNISLPPAERERLRDTGIQVHTNQDSRVVAGLQLADHAAHAMGGMLLEEIGVVKKFVATGENSGYDPAQRLELGFELWAGLRHALIGNNEHIPGLSPDPEDPANPYFKVDGYGLYVPASCTESLASHVRSRFGINYLGCIH